MLVRVTVLRVNVPPRRRTVRAAASVGGRNRSRLPSYATTDLEEQEPGQLVCPARWQCGLHLLVFRCRMSGGVAKREAAEQKIGIIG